jgi:hypothetical protein
MNKSKVKNGKQSASWLSKVFKRLFVCQQKKNKNKKGLKKFVSFKSIQLETPNQTENNNVSGIASQKFVDPTSMRDPELFKSKILKSRYYFVKFSSFLKSCF